MKKLTTLLLLFFVLSVYSQDRTHWHAYSFSIDGSDEEAVVALLDKQFSTNKAEGITAYLYSVMFSDSEFDVTHQVIFTGNADAFNTMWSSGPNVETQLFFSKMNNYFKEGGSSGNGTTVLNFNSETVFPFQVVSIVNSKSWSSRDIMRSTMKSLNEKYPRKDRGTIHGNIRSGVHPDGTHYFVAGYNSYGDLLESDRDFRISNPNYMKDRLKMNKDVDWSTFKTVRKFTRVLVKKW
ncbi:MAG: hypothetical protein P8P25_02395 [Flavobacteriaceae bacterium]|nr:hypothetical protein [Flavobacteriaceae bacterium]